MYGFCQVLGLIIGVPYILGGLMFLKPEFEVVKNILFFSTGVSLLLGALVSENILKVSFIRLLVSLVMSIGAIGCLVSIYKDFYIVNGPDYPAFIIRTVSLLVILIFLWRTCRIESKGQVYTSDKTKNNKAAKIGLK
jgi:hypothetical protein